MNDESARIHAVEHHDLKLCFGKGAAVTPACLELHGEEGAPHFRRPTPGIQFLPAGAGVQFEEKGLIRGLFVADSNDIQGGSQGSRRAECPGNRRSMISRRTVVWKQAQSMVKKNRLPAGNQVDFAQKMANNSIQRNRRISSQQISGRLYNLSVT
jgi:hypothetical protein